MRHECRSVNRNCCLGIWNLYFVFQFPNRRARCVSWILHGDIWILKSVQAPKSAARRGIWILDGPRRFLETVQFSKIRAAGRGVESGIWMTRAGSWKLKYSQNNGFDFEYTATTRDDEVRR